MKKHRRRFLGLLSSTIAAPAIMGKSRSLWAATSSDTSRSGDRLDGKDINQHFEFLGYNSLPAHDLITGHEYNGGLRYDENPGEPKAGKWKRLQPCARAEDFDRADETGTLAYFHMFVLQNNSPAYQGETFQQVLEYMVNEAGLEPQKLILVSSDWFNPYLVHLENSGLGKDQVIWRSKEEVLAAGDGSGYFNPAGHPHAPQRLSVSIHYTLDSVQDPVSSYPLPEGVLEIAEVLLTADSDSETETAGIGMERLAAAQNQSIVNFQDNLDLLITMIEREAAEREIALPEAYRLLKSKTG